MDAAYSSSGGFGMDGDRRLSPSLSLSSLASNEELHTPRARPSLALEAAFSPVAALAHDQPSTPTYSRPCTPRSPLIGSAQPACLRCVAALEQQPTIASSRRHPPNLHLIIPYIRNRPLSLAPSTHSPLPLHVDIIPNTSHLPSNNSHHPSSRGTSTLQLQSSSIALRLARNPCTV